MNVPPIEVQARDSATMFQGVVSAFPTGSKRRSGPWELGIGGVPISIFNAALLVEPAAERESVDSLSSFRGELTRRGIPGLAIAPRSWAREEAFAEAGLPKVNELLWMGRSLSDEDLCPETSRLVQNDTDAYEVAAVNAAAHGMPDDVTVLPYLWNDRRLARIIDGEEGTVSGGAVFVAEELAYVGWMATHPDHQRRGFGARLLKDLLATARKGGATRVSLHATTEGQPLYRSFGFVPGEMFDVFLCLPRESD